MSTPAAEKRPTRAQVIERLQPLHLAVLAELPTAEPARGLQGPMAKSSRHVTQMLNRQMNGDAGVTTMYVSGLIRTMAIHELVQPVRHLDGRILGWQRTDFGTEALNARRDDR